MSYIGNPPAERFTSFDYQDLTGGSGTSFTLTHPVGNAQEILVMVNNVVQEPGVAYTVSGTGLTMTGSIASTDDFYVVYRGKAIQTATHPSDRALTATDGTFTGDLTVDTNTLVVDAANNRVGIGTASPNGNGALTVNAATDNSPQIVFTENDTAKWLVGHRHDGDHFRFYDLANSAERVRIQSGGGISFNGDTAAANALDDYEEGEFTYGFGVTSGSISVRSNYAKGFYTKVGRLVTIQVRFEANSLSSPTGDVYITGFPFASAAATSDRNNTQHYSTMFRQLTGISDFGGGFITMAANATQARFQYNTPSGGVASIQGGDIQSDFQGTVAFTYVT